MNVVKEKTRRRTREKEDSPKPVRLSDEEYLQVLEKAEQESSRSTEEEDEAEEEPAVLVMPVEEEEERSIEELARLAVKRLKSRYVWIAKRGRYAFMFAIPSSERDIEQWSAEWAGFTLDFCREVLLHIVSTRRLVMLDPFNGIRSDRRRAVRFILGSLVKQELARWIDEAEGLIRVFWKTDEEWADEIHRWALDTGRTTFTLFKLKEQRDDLESLPKSELREILDILVKQKRARWLDKEREVLEIKI